jgi:primosomal protein N''
MRVQIKPAHQIQRINSLINQLEALQQTTHETFMKRPNPKAWCGAEVIQHMIVAHQVYEVKLTDALAKSTILKEEVDVRSTHAIPSFLIKRFPPKEGKIRFKMKTMKVFQPMLDVEKLTENDVQALIAEMKKTLVQLSNWVEQTRKRDILPHRFNSAIGALVRFNPSEACEFILCHNERHFLQLERTLKQAN